MGIPGLLTALRSVTYPVHISEYKGLTVGVDAYCWWVLILVSNRRVTVMHFQFFHPCKPIDVWYCVLTCVHDSPCLCVHRPQQVLSPLTYVPVASKYFVLCKRIPKLQSLLCSVCQCSFVSLLVTSLQRLHRGTFSCSTELCTNSNTNKWDLLYEAHDSRLDLCNWCTVHLLLLIRLYCTSFAPNIYFDRSTRLWWKDFTAGARPAVMMPYLLQFQITSCC